MSAVKSTTFNSVEFAMLQELAKRNRMKPDAYLKKLIQVNYGTGRR